jgi:hypothetical protein
MHEGLITVIRLKQKGFDYMTDTKSLSRIGILLLAAVFIAGCVSPGSAPAPTVIPTTVQTSLPTTVMEIPIVTVATTIKTTTVTTTPAQTSAEKEILHEKGMLTTTTFKSYDFKDLGYKFLYPNDKFRVTLRSEKPVLGYAVNSEQALQLQGEQLVPHYESYSKKIQWGLVKPSMILEKVTDSTKEFTVEDVGPLSYVVDGRWMSFDSVYESAPPFNYELTIIKISGPTPQNFNF